MMNAGYRLVVPAIADYEVRRELERARRSQGLAQLDAFNAARADRYLALSDMALRLAAKLWAQARNAGIPTADPKELDCDVLIAAQALTLGIPTADLVIATTNVGHLARFVPAALWANITP
jgi:predicted nucleic acid-binding protein